MRKLLMVALLISLSTSPLFAADGLVSIKSNYTTEQTADRLAGIFTNKGMTIFSRVKHSKSAALVGVELRPTELLIFGNPKVGSPLMKCSQSVAIDLPLKALVWQDDKSNVWISYNDPSYLTKRHDIKGCEKVLDTMTKALAGMTKAAAE